MIRDRVVEMRVAEPSPATARVKKHGAGRYRPASWLFAREGVSEAVATRVHFDASPEAAWDRLMFFEEVPGRAPLLLRALLPRPIRTEGDKTRIGTKVRCVYKGGDLVKRITSVEAPHLLEFEVVDQRLGIEDCIRTLGGSYQIYSCGDAADVVLITNYEAYLRPRSLWRPLETLLVSQLHKHILRGVSAAVFHRDPAVRPAVAESLKPLCAPPGGLACTVLQSSSRR
ncbi:MAG: hypothetical protein WBD73_00260 [Candidatus Acidiferrales bacterium]